MAGSLPPSAHRKNKQRKVVREGATWHPAKGYEDFFAAARYGRGYHGLREFSCRHAPTFCHGFVVGGADMPIYRYDTPLRFATLLKQSI
jgi:hypothetical protein